GVSEVGVVGAGGERYQKPSVWQNSGCARFSALVVRAGHVCEVVPRDVESATTAPSATSATAPASTTTSAASTTTSGPPPLTSATSNDGHHHDDAGPAQRGLRGPLVTPSGFGP